MTETRWTRFVFPPSQLPSLRIYILLVPILGRLLCQQSFGGIKASTWMSWSDSHLTRWFFDMSQSDLPPSSGACCNTARWCAPQQVKWGRWYDTRWHWESARWHFAELGVSWNAQSKICATRVIFWTQRGHFYLSQEKLSTETCRKPSGVWHDSSTLNMVHIDTEKQPHKYTHTHAFTQTECVCWVSVCVSHTLSTNAYTHTVLVHTQQFNRPALYYNG